MIATTMSAPTMSDERTPGRIRFFRLMRGRGRGVAESMLESVEAELLITQISMRSAGFRLCATSHCMTIDKNNAEKQRFNADILVAAGSAGR